MTEGFTAWYSGNPIERFWLFNRSFGPYWWAFWALMLCNMIAPQALWFSRVRSTPWLLFIIAIIVNIGMWLERYVIIVVSLHRDFLPSSWGVYAGTRWDWSTYAGTIGLFLTMVFIFIRVLPMISIFEMRHLLEETKKHEEAEHPEHPAAKGTALVHQPTNNVSIDPSLPLYGLMAEFDVPTNCLPMHAPPTRLAIGASRPIVPFPIEELPEAIGLRKTKLPIMVLLGGIVGALAGFFMQYYAAVIDYPWNIGGRPLNSWPSFIIVTFETTILFAAGAAALGMLLLNGLPQPYHSVFNAPRFKLASQDRFFLCIEANDPKFDLVKTREFLNTLRPAEVVAVEK